MVQKTMLKKNHYPVMVQLKHAGEVTGVQYIYLSCIIMVNYYYIFVEEKTTKTPNFVFSPFPLCFAVNLVEMTIMETSFS